MKGWNRQRVAGSMRAWMQAGRKTAARRDVNVEGDIVHSHCQFCRHGIGRDRPQLLSHFWRLPTTCTYGPLYMAPSVPYLLRWSHLPFFFHMSQDIFGKKNLLASRASLESMIRKVAQGGFHSIYTCIWARITLPANRARCAHQPRIHDLESHAGVEHWAR